MRAWHAYRYWLLQYRRTWRGTIVISVANPVLFLLGIGVGLGHLVDHGNSAAIGGVSYSEFFAPGLLAASAMQTGYLEGLPLGTRGGVVARHTFPLDGQYVLKASLLQTNLGAARGLLEPHEIEFSIDGLRVFVATVGGDQDNARSAANAAEVRIEGVSARNAWGGSATSSFAPSVEAIESVNVVTGTPDAEQGIGTVAVQVRL